MSGTRVKEVKRKKERKKRRRERKEREGGEEYGFNSIRGYISNPKIFEEDGRSRKREIETNAHWKESEREDSRTKIQERGTK